MLESQADDLIEELRKANATLAIIATAITNLVTAVDGVRIQLETMEGS